MFVGGQKRQACTYLYEGSKQGYKGLLHRPLILLRLMIESAYSKSANIKSLLRVPPSSSLRVRGSGELLQTGLVGRVRAR